MEEELCTDAKCSCQAKQHSWSRVSQPTLKLGDGGSRHANFRSRSTLRETLSGPGQSGTSQNPLLIPQRLNRIHLGRVESRPQPKDDSDSGRETKSEQYRIEVNRHQKVATSPWVTKALATLVNVVLLHSLIQMRRTLRPSSRSVVAISSGKPSAMDLMLDAVVWVSFIFNGGGTGNPSTRRL